MCPERENMGPSYPFPHTLPGALLPYSCSEFRSFLITSGVAPFYIPDHGRGEIPLLCTLVSTWYYQYLFFYFGCSDRCAVVLWEFETTWGELLETWEGTTVTRRPDAHGLPPGAITWSEPTVLHAQEQL